MDMNTIIDKHLNAPMSEKTFPIICSEFKSIDYHSTSSSSSSSLSSSSKTTITETSNGLIEKEKVRNPYLRHIRQNYSNELNSSTESFHSSITLIADCVCAGDDYHPHCHTNCSSIDQLDTSDESNLSMLTTTTTTTTTSSTTSISKTTAKTLTTTNLMIINSDIGIGFVGDENGDEEGEDIDELDSIIDEEFLFEAKKLKLFNCLNRQLDDINNNNLTSISISSSSSSSSSSSLTNDNNHINNHIQHIQNNNNNNENETDYLHPIITSFSLANNHHSGSCHRSNIRFDKQIHSTSKSSNSSVSHSPSSSSSPPPPPLLSSFNQTDCDDNINKNQFHPHTHTVRTRGMDMVPVSDFRQNLFHIHTHWYIDFTT
ncbi:hypothetical protein DERF_006099 [Dermatophagoides farinae]|uniref:Uncharacterized protein n=1 Tax=Dermatophagoides farinae TaxID=6954 RepID=A0A922LBW3_DERFA|nr:hypothetical protein DERF_006099 [Dermatophagoides farinae]